MAYGVRTVTSTILFCNFITRSVLCVKRKGALGCSGITVLVLARIGLLNWAPTQSPFCKVFCFIYMTDTSILYYYSILLWYIFCRKVFVTSQLCWKEQWSKREGKGLFCCIMQIARSIQRLSLYKTGGVFFCLLGREGGPNCLCFEVPILNLDIFFFFCWNFSRFPFLKKKPSVFFMCLN